MGPPGLEPDDVGWEGLLGSLSRHDLRWTALGILRARSPGEEKTPSLVGRLSLLLFRALGFRSSDSVFVQIRQGAPDFLEQ